MKFLMMFKAKIATIGEKSMPEPSNPNEFNKVLKGPKIGSVNKYKYLYNWLLLFILNHDDMILPKINKL